MSSQSVERVLVCRPLTALTLRVDLGLKRLLPRLLPVCIDGNDDSSHLPSRFSGLKGE